MGLWDQLKELWQGSKEEVAKEAGKQAAKAAAAGAVSGAKAAAGAAVEKAGEAVSGAGESFVSFLEGELASAQEAREGRESLVPDSLIAVEDADFVTAETAEAPLPQPTEAPAEQGEAPPDSTPLLPPGPERSLGWARREREAREASAVDELAQLKAQLGKSDDADADERTAGPGVPPKRTL